MEKPLPIWSERERPTALLIDVHDEDRDYARLPDSDAGENDDYLAWINEYKESVHDELRTIHHRTIERLERRNINLAEINAAVADVTGQSAYPLSRIVTASDANGLLDYSDAARAGFFKKAMHFGDGQAFGQFEYIMHFVRFRGEYLNRAPKLSVIDTIAHELGHAALAKVTYGHIDRSPDTVVYHWFGASWRYDDEYYGEVLDEASAAKVAAESRRQLGLTTNDHDTLHPLLAPYKEKHGYSYATIGAVALDVLGVAAGHRDSVGIYRQLWDYMASAQDDAARIDLADSVQRATKGALSLEDFEAQAFTTRGVSLDFLEKVEEACDMDVVTRPSSAFSNERIF